jgi:hypothetical protein
MNRRILPLFLVIVFFSLCGCAGLKQGQTGMSTLGIETLIARDLGGGDEVYYTRWCGNTGLIYSRVNAGIELVDIRSRERTKINLSSSGSPLNCTSDGEKLLYYDYQSIRVDDEITEPDELGPGSFGMYQYTEDIYAYEVRTGKKTLVATTRNSGEYDAISPDGSKILLGSKHRLASKKDAAEWEGVWFTKKWDPIRAKWFPDSSGIITHRKTDDHRICVEKFGNNGWAKCFKEDNTGDDVKVGRDNRIYYLDRDAPLDELYHLYLQRCDIKEEGLDCERILKGFDDVMPSYDFLPDGDIIFYDLYQGECIRRATPGRDNARCVITPDLGGTVYDSISLTGISPDGRWLAFKRYNRGKRKINGDGYHWKLDLFVIELTDN